MHNFNPFLRRLVQNQRNGGGGGLKAAINGKKRKKEEQNQKQVEGHNLILIQGHRRCSSVSQMLTGFNFERWGKK